jgi:hypothetical protein
MTTKHEYQRFSAWLGVANGFPKAQAMEDEGWELVTIVPICFLGGTFAYTFVMRRPR